MRLRVDLRRVCHRVDLREYANQRVFRHFLHGRARERAHQVRNARRIFRHGDIRGEQAARRAPGGYAAKHRGQAGRQRDERRQRGMPPLRAAPSAQQGNQRQGVQRRAGQRKRRAIEQHAAQRALFIQQRQRSDEQQRAERVDLRGAARRQKALRQNQAEQQQRFAAQPPAPAIRRVRRQHGHQQERAHARELEHIHVVNRPARQKIQRRHRRGGEVEPHVVHRREPRRVHPPDEREHLLDEQIRLVVDAHQQDHKPDGQQKLPDRQPPEALVIQQRRRQQHEKLHRRRQGDIQRAVAPAADVVQVAQRAAADVVKRQQQGKRRRQRRAKRQRMAIQPCRKGVQLRFHAASPPFIASAARFLRILRSTSRETTTSAASIISASIRISAGRWRVIKGM